MPGPLVILADDLTGACEIAGAALGRIDTAPRVVLGPPSADEPAQGHLTVYDTQTRLCDAASASRCLARAGAVLAARSPNTRLFKKTDSVLRGPVWAELSSLAGAIGARRTLLVPANPALGRTILHGRYRVYGEPLHQTAYAHDPDYPALTDEVAGLLGTDARPLCHVASAGTPLPPTGLTIGDTESVDDLVAWAQAVSPGVLPAGSTAFFEAMLELRQTAPRQATTPPPSVPALLVSGTTFAGSHALIEAHGDCLTLDDCESEAAVDVWISRLCEQLRAAPKVVAGITGPTHRAPTVATVVTEVLARAAVDAIESGACRHLVVEGGATASAICAQLGWHHFSACHEWAQGVVTLRPESAPHCWLTLKPGSYPWPEPLARRFFGESASPAGQAAR